MFKILALFPNNTLYVCDTLDIECGDKVAIEQLDYVTRLPNGLYKTGVLTKMFHFHDGPFCELDMKPFVLQTVDYVSKIYKILGEVHEDSINKFKAGDTFNEKNFSIFWSNRKGRLADNAYELVFSNDVFQVCKFK